MNSLHSFELAAADGKMIRGDRAEARIVQILFITGFLSKRWATRAKALAEWCRGERLGFVAYDCGVRRLRGRSPITRCRLDRRCAVDMLKDGSPITIVAIHSWLDRLMMAQECSAVESLFSSPSIRSIGVRAREISADRRKRWHDTGWMPWDDDPVHRIGRSREMVEESDDYWSRRFDQVRRVKTTLLHGLQDRTIHPRTSWQFVDELLVRDPDYPVELTLTMGDHRTFERVRTSRIASCAWSTEAPRKCPDVGSSRSRLIVKVSFNGKSASTDCNSSTNCQLVRGWMVRS